MDETLVARNVDEAERRPRRRSHEGEPKIDGDAARFLFLEAIAIDSGQRPHQSRFSMIDMSGQSDDHGCPSGEARGSDAGASVDVASFLKCGKLDRKASSSARQRK